MRHHIQCALHLTYAPTSLTSCRDRHLYQIVAVFLGQLENHDAEGQAASLEANKFVLQKVEESHVAEDSGFRAGKIALDTFYNARINDGVRLFGYRSGF